MDEAVEDPFALAGTTLERRFAIDRVVARGGFGVVYQGRHVTLKKPVAVKVLVMPTGFSTEEKRVFLQSFEQEAQTIAALEHPAIVRAYDFGVARPPGRREMPWLALEWIDGESLADRLASRGGRPMAPAEALALLRPALQGLAFAHARHVAHRDLKPANIMLTEADADAGLATARLLDFGIAKVMNPDEAVGTGATRTMAAFTAFSTPYAAPEQKAGRRTGPWTDVHAVGLILTEMLTGRAPYPGDDPVSVELAILSPERPTPARAGVDVGVWEPVLAKAVALNPSDRFPDVAGLLAALEANVPGASPPAAAPEAPPAEPAFAPTAAVPAADPPPAAPPPPAMPPPAMPPPAMPAFAPPAYTPPPPPAYMPPAQPPFAAPAFAAPPPAFAASGYAMPPAQGLAPPQSNSRRTLAIVAGSMVALLFLTCVLCVAFAPDPKDAQGGGSPPQGPPQMTPIPSR